MSDSEVDSSAQDDPIQQMIQQALAAQKPQPAMPPNYVMANAEPQPGPTLGERIGAKSPAMIRPAQPQPQAPPISSVVPQSAPPAALTAGLDRKPVPAAPVGSNNPNLTSALAEQQKYATPLDPKAVDPKTGKQIYRMGWGQRLAGIAENFASGMAGRGPVSYIGPGATNARFDREDQLRQANLEKANLNVAGQEKLDTSNLNLEKEAQKQAYEGQLGEYRIKLGEAAEKNAETRDLLSQSQIDLREAQANKANQPKEPQTEAEIALAKQMAIMKGDKQKAAIYDGALRELAKQKIAGREPKDTTAADIAKAIQVAEYRGRETDKVDKAKEEERNKRYGEIDKDVKVKYNSQKVAAAKAQADQALETKYADKYKTVNDQADQMLGLTKAGANLKSTSGKPLSLDEAKDYLKRAGGDKDKARNLAKKDGRTF